MKVLILDNYDSFTYNLAQLVAAASGSDPVVLYNDAVSEAELQKLDFDAVVLSPGPGRPDRKRDFGLCETILKDYRKPVLGVCLGHQGIAQHFGARIVRAPEVFHGKASRVRHEGSKLFAGLPEVIEVMRYHSLIAAQDGFPECLEITARTDDDHHLIMACAHVERPLYGIQFHPESIGSPYGMAILERFLRL